MSHRARLLLILMFVVALCQGSFAANSTSDSVAADTIRINKGRLTGLLIAQGSLYFGSIATLYYAWYRDYPQTTMHLFNDNGEWMQIDKIGHTTTAYYISRITHYSYRWAGLDRNRSILYGGLFGFAYMLNIEILDGFSAGWGFSLGDVAANTAGCLLFMTQQYAWNEQRFLLKYSYHQTQYSKYRPDLLGENLLQNTIKDYNGATYWLSGNIHSFLPEKSKFPRWINVAVGYGAEGMTGANGNSTTNGSGVKIPEFTPYRKFFLSVDIDLTRIRTRSKVLETLFNVIGFLKIPAPAIEFNTRGQIIFHPFYF